MAVAPDIIQVLDRIANGAFSDADVAALRHSLLVTGERNVVQLGKYNVQIEDGHEIRIGDTIYQGLDAESVREVVRTILAEMEPALLIERPGRYPASVEPRVPSYFQDREPELKRLNDLIRRGRWIGVFALGGTGKTMLAAKVVAQIREVEQLRSVWLEVGEAFDVNELQESIARSVGSSLQQVSDPRLRASHLRGITDGAGVLIVLDDVNDDHACEELLGAIGNGNTVVLTSRNPAMRSVKRFGLEPVVLDPIPESAATDLLLLLTGRETVSQEERDRWQVLAAAVGNLPLAIEIVAGELSFRPDQALEVYMREHVETGRWILEDRASVGLVTAIRKSAEQLGERYAEAFACLGVFAGTALTIPGVQQVCGLASADDAFTFLANLQRRMLIRSAGDGLFTMHPIVRQAAREALIEQRPEARNDSVHRYLGHYLELLRRHGGYEWNMEEYPHLVPQETEVFMAIDKAYQQWQQQEAGSDQRFFAAYTIRMTSQISWYLYWRGYWHKRVAYCKRVTDQIGKTLDEVAELRLENSLANLFVDEGWAHLRWGEMDRARHCAAEALKLFGGRMDVIYARELAGQIAMESGDPETALDVFSQLVERVYKGTRAWFIFSFKIADALGALGRGEEQERLLRALIAEIPNARLERKTIIADVHAQLLFRLAKCKSRSAELDENRRLLEESMTLFEQAQTVIEDRVDAMLVLAETMTATEEQGKRLRMLESALEQAKLLGYLDAANRIEIRLQEMGSATRSVS